MNTHGRIVEGFIIYYKVSVLGLQDLFLCVQVGVCGSNATCVGAFRGQKRKLYSLELECGLCGLADVGAGRGNPKLSSS